MANNASHSKASASGWWRVIAVILFVLGVTLGLAFYLPLRQSHELLTNELASMKREAAQLSENLTRTETSLEQETAARKALDEFKAEVHAEKQKYPELAKRFVEDPEPAIRASLDKKRIEASALGDGVSVAWINPALLNWKRTAPSRTGFGLLCPSLKRAKSLDLPQVTIRAFTAADTAPPDTEEAYTTASELAIEVAQRIVRYCSIPPQSLSVASSPGTKDSPLLQLEFRAGPTNQGVGL